MRENSSNRTRRLCVRFSPEEFDKFQGKFQQSTARRISDYARKVLLEQPVKVKRHNQSLDDFMAELIRLRGELNAIGNNYNQVVHKLHMLDTFPEIQTWLLLHESARKIVLGKVSEIKEKINQINDVWLAS